jgi:hypothetical protein
MPSQYKADIVVSATFSVESLCESPFAADGILAGQKAL